MKPGMRTLWWLGGAFVLALWLGSGVSGCSKDADGTDEGATATAPSKDLSAYGSIEVTAELAEIPGLDEPPWNGELRSDLDYDYAYVMKYRIRKVHRGELPGDTVLVAVYNPFLPRDEVADERCPDIGGNVKRFRVGDVHRLALEADKEEHYMGATIDKYYEQTQAGEKIRWAVWVVDAE